MSVTYEFYDKLPEEAVEIRKKVFVEEQKFSEEFDTIDNTAIHTVIKKDGIAVATGRLFCSDGVWHIGRVAVRRENRGEHLGEKVMELLCEKARESGAKSVEVSAQCRARGFYEKLGFEAQGEVYYDEYCEHIRMTKSLV